MVADETHTAAAEEYQAHFIGRRQVAPDFLLIFWLASALSGAARWLGDVEEVDAPHIEPQSNAPFPRLSMTV